MKIQLLLLLIILAGSASALDLYEVPKYTLDLQGEKTLNPEFSEDTVPTKNAEGSLFTEDGIIALVSTSSDSPLSAGVLSFSGKGYDENQPYAGTRDVGVVNLYSGALTRTDVDHSTSAKALGVSVARTYNSNIFKSVGTETPDSALPMINSFTTDARLNKPTPFGHGWSGWHYGRILSPMYFVCDQNSAVSEWTWEKPDGSRETFVKDLDDQYPGEWRLSDGSRVEFINVYEHFANGPNTDDTGLELIVITSPDGTRYIFSHHVYPSIGYIDGSKIQNIPGDGIAWPSNDAVTCVATDPRGPGSQWISATSQFNLPSASSNSYTDLFYGVGQAYPEPYNAHRTVDNHLAGIYLTRIEDVNGNYITFEYDEEQSRGFELYTVDPENSYQPLNGNQLGYEISKGSPYIQTVRDTNGKTINYEYQKLPGAQNWQKRIKQIMFTASEGNEQKLVYTYGLPNPSNGAYTSCISSSTNPSNDVGICVSDGFLQKVELQDSEDNLLLPPTEYIYDKNTGELIKVKFGNGGEVSYVYTTKNEYFYDFGGAALPGGDATISRRTLHLMSVKENPSSTPIKTYYFYDGPDQNNLNGDDYRRTTYVLHPVSKEKVFDTEGNQVYGSDGLPLKQDLYTAEAVLYMSPNPKKAFTQVLDHLTGVELQRSIYEYSTSEGGSLPLRYSADVIQNDREIISYDYTMDGLEVLNSLRTADKVSDTFTQYDAKSLGYHSFYTMHLGGFFGNDYAEILPAKTPHDVAKIYKAHAIGKKTINYEGGTRTTFSYSQLDDFGNPKLTQNFGVVQSASKEYTGCNDININLLTASYDPKCAFEGSISVEDDLSYGDQEYSRTEYSYAHESTQPSGMPSYGSWFLGGEPQIRVCNTDGCDPISDYRNVLFQRLNLPTQVSTYDIDGNLISRTKNYYDEYNPELAGVGRDNYDTPNVGNHRQILFQHGIDLTGDICKVRRGLLTSSELNFFEDGESRTITQVETIYDTMGNVRKVTFPNQESGYLGYDAFASEPTTLNDVCAPLLLPGERVENGRILLSQDELFLYDDGSNKVVGDGSSRIIGFGKAYPTETKSGGYKKNTEYDLYSGNILHEEISNLGHTTESTYEYDNLNRVIKTFGPTDIYPKTIVEYVDFPLEGMPQEAQVYTKLLKPKTTLIFETSADSRMIHSRDLLRQYGTNVEVYEIDTADLVNNPAGVLSDIETRNIFTDSTAIIWLGNRFDLFLREVNRRNSPSNPNSFGKYLLQGGSMTVIGLQHFESLLETVELQQDSQLVYGEEIKLWNDFSFQTIQNDQSFETKFTYEPIIGVAGSNWNGFSIPAGHFSTGAFEGTLPRVWQTTTNMNYQLIIDYPNREYDLALAASTHNNQIQFLSLLPSLIDPEYLEEYMENIFYNPISTMYSNPIRNFYDGLGRNYVSVQEDTDGKYIISHKEFDPADQSVRREFKSIKVDKFQAEGTDCFTSPANAVSCYLDGAVSLEENQPGIEYFKDALKRVVRVRSHGSDLGTINDRDITTEYLEGQGLNVKTDKEGKVLKSYADGAGNLVKEEIVSDTKNKIVEREYSAFGTPSKTIVKEYNTAGQDRAINFNYDTKGRLLSVRSPDFGVISYEYDEMDNLISTTNALGEQILNVNYDNLNRLTETRMSGIPGSIQYVYDDSSRGMGQARTITDYSGVYDYTYDQDGRVRTETVTPTICAQYSGSQELCAPITLTYEYFPDGAISSVSDGESTISYVRDSLGRIKKVLYYDGIQIHEILKDADYTPAGSISYMLLGNDVTETYDYYNREIELLKSHTIENNEETLYERGYKYTPSLNLESEYSSRNMLPSTKLAGYEYDEFNQLKRVNDEGYYGKNYWYKYDLLGNILEVETTPGDQTSLVTDTYEYYAGTSRLEETNEYSYEYDAAGRATKQLGKWQLIPSGDEWVDWTNGGGSASFDKNAITIIGTDTHASLSYNIPVKYGQKYVISGTINHDLTQGYAIIGTGCGYNQEWLGQECLLDNFAEERRVTGSGTQNFEFIVEARSAQATDLTLSVLCKLGSDTIPSTGTITCSNLKVREAHQTYTYNPQNMLTMVLLEGGECLKYHYDYQNRRVFEADSSSQRLTRYVFMGTDIHSKLGDDVSISCPAEPSWPIDLPNIEQPVDEQTIVEPEPVVTEPVKEPVKTKTPTRTDREIAVG